MAQVSVWSGAVIRGDLNSIRVNAFSSIGDRTVVHAARCQHIPSSSALGLTLVCFAACAAIAKETDAHSEQGGHHSKPPIDVEALADPLTCALRCVTRARGPLASSPADPVVQNLFCFNVFTCHQGLRQRGCQRAPRLKQAAQNTY